mgnify:CR=1 FL=1|tara:strand:- start:8981 stop:9190 length:210 start_codon:yes stop_codon:yes gene_type:complete
MEYSKHMFNMHWAIALRNGFGFDIEAVSSRATWAYDPEEDEIVAIPFSGIVINLPLLTIVVGNQAENLL